MIKVNEQSSVWRLGEILIQKEWITWQQLSKALNEQRVNQCLLGEILIRKGLLSERNLYRALAIQRCVPFVELTQARIESEAMQAVPRWLVCSHRVMPIEKGQNTLLVATSNPANMWAKAVLNEITGIEDVRYAMAMPEDIDGAIARYYGSTSRVA